ncbi:MAG: hypothetical protein CSB44_10995 [Gammaproteobacteria bacterium]|nr:MAG: hypothetical protein CSB44_10995 [Gammaproteobacteria bacterium]
MLQSRIPSSLQSLPDRAAFRRHLARGSDLPRGTLQGCLLFLKFVELESLARHDGDVLAAKALADLVAVIEVRLRSRDYLARISRDTVVILLHRCRLAHARRVAGNYLDLFSDLELHVDHKPWRVQLRYRLMSLDEHQLRLRGGGWICSGRLPGENLLGANRFGSEHIGTARAGVAHAGTERAGTERAGAAHAGAAPAGTERAGADGSVERLSGMQRNDANLPAAHSPDVKPLPSACTASATVTARGHDSVVAFPGRLDEAASTTKSASGTEGTCAEVIPLRGGTVSGAPLRNRTVMAGSTHDSHWRLEPGVSPGLGNAIGSWRLRHLGEQTPCDDRQRLEMALDLLAFYPPTGGTRLGGELIVELAAESLLPLTVNWLIVEARERQVAPQDLCLSLSHPDIMNHLSLVIPAMRNLRRAGFRCLLREPGEPPALAALRRLVYFDMLQIPLSRLAAMTANGNTAAAGGNALCPWAADVKIECLVTGVDTPADYRRAAASGVEFVFGRHAGKTLSVQPFLDTGDLPDGGDS